MNDLDSSYQGSYTQQSLVTEEIPRSEAALVQRTDRIPSKDLKLSKMVAVIAERDLGRIWHHRGLPLKDYSLLRGSGGFYDIYESTLTDTNHPWVQRRQRKCNIDQFTREVAALARDDIKAHINIAQVHAWGFDMPFDTSDIALVLHIENAIGSLKTLLASSPQSTDAKHCLCLGVAEGLRHVHSCGIVHGDMKPDNILVTKSADPLIPLEAKLTDFGAFIDLNSPQSIPWTYDMYAGTKGWRAPEVYRDETRSKEVLPPQLFFKCESYTYGLLVLSVFLKNGQQPCEPAMLEELQNESLISQPLASIMKARISELLCFDPMSRPEVDPKLLSDDGETFHNWDAREETLLSVPDASNPVLRHWLNFWYRIDRPIYSQLYNEYETDSSGFCSASLFGLALSAASNTLNDHYQERTLKYTRAAAVASCLAARAIVAHVHRAVSPDTVVPTATESLQQNGWLFEAAANGSLTARWELGRTAPILEEQAWQMFRKCGGYSARPSPIGISARHNVSQTDPTTLRLHDAAIYGNGDAIRRLAGLCSMDVRDHEGKTAIYKAATAGNFETLAALVHLNADASITTAVGHISCLHWLFMFKPNLIEAVLRMLRSQHADVSARLKFEVGYNYPQDVLFEHFPFQWPLGTPFHWACFTRSFSAMEALLRVGVDVDELDIEPVSDAQTPCSPLSLAMSRGDAEVVSFLLQHGANPRQSDSRGWNPLHMLANMRPLGRFPRLPGCLYPWCYHGSQDTHVDVVSQCVDLAVKAGVDVNARIDYLYKVPGRVGNTPLLLAIISKDGGTTLALLKAGGADVFLGDTGGRLPIHYWANLDGQRLYYPGTWEPVFRLLIDHSSHADAIDTVGINVFQEAVRNSSFDYFRRAMNLLLASPMKEYVEPGTKGGRDVLKAILNWTINKGDLGGDIQPRFEYLFNSSLSVELDREDVCELMWDTCRNPMLSDVSCLSIVKKLLTTVEDGRHGYLISKLRDSASTERRRVGDLQGPSRYSDQGTNVLMMAAAHARLETFKFLLRPGTDLRRTTIHGYSVLDFALHTAEQLRRLGLERWSLHGPQNEPPRHRGQRREGDSSNYRELFWWEPGLDNEHVAGNSSIYRKEQYFAIMDIVKLVVQRVGIPRRRWFSMRSKIARPREGDAEMTRTKNWGHLFEPKKQPYYDMWELLYQYD